MFCALRRASTQVQSLKPDRVCRLGIARTFQNIRLFSSLSVLDNVKIGFHPRTHANVLGAILRGPGTRNVKSARLKAPR